MPPRDKTLPEQDAIARYTTQPSVLPRALRDEVERVWGGQPVQLYAMADLDASFNLAQIWIAVGPEHYAVMRPNGDGAPHVQSHARQSVSGVRETPGLSCNTLYVLGGEEDAPLSVLRYTHRQRRAMENVRLLLEQKPDEEGVKPRDADEVYKESMTKAVRDVQASSATKKLTVVWRLTSYVKPYAARLALGLAAAVVITVVSLAPPHLTGKVIDDVVKPFQTGALTRAGAMHMGLVILAGLAAAYVMRSLCLWVRLRTLSVLGEYIARDLRRELYEHLQKLSLRFYSSKQTGSIITRVSSDTDRIWDFVAFGLVEVTLSVVMLIGLGVVLIIKDPLLGTLMVLPVPVMLYSFFVHSKRMRRLFLKIWRKWSAMTAVLSDTIPGMRVVKAFNQEDHETQRFNRCSDSVAAQANQLHAVWTKFWPGLTLTMHAITLMIWFFALPRLLPNSGAATLTPGVFIAFLMYVGMFFQPIETIGMITRMMNRATSSAIRIFEVLDTEPDVVDNADPVRLEPVEGRVEFDHVTFAYDGVRPVIRDMSFAVEPGEMIGLVGPSGAGKSTVTNLLVRFYDVTSGRILIDGVDLRELEVGAFRKQVGMVLQDPHLFHGAILDNIRYGAPDASLDRVIEAARAANAHDFICRLPHGYDTIVGERGHTLSGGERQRVSIARAVLLNPRVLILDEATSSVDTETERKIQEALDRLVKGRTVFAIAHRLSTLRRADRLFVIEDGKISEMGTHAELLAKEDGTYRKLYDMQQELHMMYAV